MNFVIQAYMSYKGLFLWLNWPAYVINVFLTPALFLIMFVLTGRYASGTEGAGVYVVGMCAYAIPMILMAGVVQTFAYERLFGTVSLIFGSTGNRLMIYWSRGWLHYPNGIFSFSFGIFLAWLLLDLDLGAVDWPALILSVLLITASATAFALFVGNFAMAFGEWFILLFATQGLLMSLTGVIVPTDSLPDALEGFGHLLPLTHGLTALRGSFAGSGIATVGGDLLLELAVGLGYAMAGPAIFRFLEADAKRRGTYENAPRW